MPHPTNRQTEHANAIGPLVSRALVTAALANLAYVVLGGRWSFEVLDTPIENPSVGLSLLAAIAAWAFANSSRTARLLSQGTGAARRSIRQYRYAAGLAALAIAGFALRTVGRDFGLPLIPHPDEPGVLAVAARMLRDGTLDPDWFIYPTLYLYLILPLMGLSYISARSAGLVGDLTTISHLEPGFLLAARTVSAVAGIATLVPIYAAARNLWDGERGRQAGMVAAALVTFSFIHVRESQYAVTDTVLTFLLSIALVGCVGILRSGLPRHYFLAGFAGGLAGAAKYSALPIVVVILAAHLLGRRARNWIDSRPLLSAAGLAAGFVAGAPYSVLNPDAFLDHLAYLTTVGSPGIPHERLMWLIGYGMESGFGPILMAASCVIAVAVLHRRDKRELLLLVYVLAFMAQVTYADIKAFPRYWLPAMPGLVLLFGGYTVNLAWWLRERLAWPTAARTLLVTVATILACWPTGREAISWTRARTFDSAPTLAYEWIQANAPPRSIVATEVPMVAARSRIDFYDYPAGVHARNIREWRRDGVDIMALSGAIDDGVATKGPERRAREQLRRRLVHLQSFDAPGIPAVTGPSVHIYRVLFRAVTEPVEEGDVADEPEAQEREDG